MKSFFIGASLPVALATAYVLSTYSASAAPSVSLWRPLLIVAGGAFAVHITVAAVVRDRSYAALTSAALGSALLAVWLFALPLLALLGGWIALRTIRVLRRRPSLPAAGLVRMADSATIFSLVLVALAAWEAVSASQAGLSPGEAPEVAESAAGAPDVYLFLLDGYPRGDTLMTAFGFDNRPFLDGLAARGFEVSNRSRSNYASTWATVASMLHMRYLDEIDGLFPAPDSLQLQERLLNAAINSGSVVEAFRELGYSIIAIPSPLTSTALVSADRVIDPGSITQFEEYLLRRTILMTLFEAPLEAMVSANQRDAFAAGLASVVTLAESGHPERSFLLAHLMAPHPPFVLAPGTSPALGGCYPASCGPWEFREDVLGMSSSEYAAHMQSQVAHVNAELLAAVDRITAANPDAVIVLVSDHGSRHTTDDLDEWFHTLFAARTPGAPDLFADDVSPVNVFPEIFSAYFGANLPNHEYRAWQPAGGVLELAPYVPTP